MVDKNPALEKLKASFPNEISKQIEKDVVDGVYRMKDVATCFGISKQVASKIVNPTDPRTTTAFELFRYSVLKHEPVINLVTPEMYMTPNELNDRDLCTALGISPDFKRGLEALSSLYIKLPGKGRRFLLAMAQALQKTLCE